MTLDILALGVDRKCHNHNFQLICINYCNIIHRSPNFIGTFVKIKTFKRPDSPDENINPATFCVPVPIQESSAYFYCSNYCASVFQCTAVHYCSNFNYQ